MVYQPVEIVLIEDDENDVELSLRALKKARLANGIKVISDGEEAREFVLSIGEDSALKLILLDVKLPKVSGLEILELLKSRTESLGIPVVVLTSSKEALDARKAYDLGVNSFIVKPIDFDSFVKAVEEIGLYWAVLNKAPGM